METLPNELIIEIFNHIQKITDKRQFLKTCIHYNNLTKQSFINYELNYELPYFDKINGYCVEKFTLELCHDSYFNLIPNHYITPTNENLMSCLSYYNCVELLELAQSKGCNLDGSMEVAATAGHINVIKWFMERNQNEMFLLIFAVTGGHIHVIKWLHEIGHDLTNLCYFAIEENQFELLKYGYEIGCELDIELYGVALCNDNQEIVNWLIENGCSPP